MADDAKLKTDRMIYVVQADDYWSDSIWVTKDGGIIIKVKGHAINMTLQGWHQCALDHFAREAQYSSAPQSAKAEKP